MTGFRLWLWTMLAVIALSAAPSGGPLRMQIIGSAFDPATTSVALVSKRQSGQSAVTARRNDTPQPPSFALIFSLAAALSLAAMAIITRRVPFAAREPVPARAGHPPGRSHRPRAPPLS